MAVAGIGTSVATCGIFRGIYLHLALAGSGTAVAVCVMSVASAGTWHRQVVTSQWQSVAVCGNLCHVRGISTSLHILKLSFAQFLFVLNFLILSKYTLLSVHNIA